MADAGHGVLTTEWADGEYTFRLEWKHWFELDDKCKCGPNELLERLVMKRWRAGDVYEVIRLGLIGGGKSPVEALKMADRYIKGRPLLENVPLAIRIVSASLIGPDVGDDDAGEPAVATENATTKDWISASSTATPPSSGSHHKT